MSHREGLACVSSNPAYREVDIAVQVAVDCDARVVPVPSEAPIPDQPESPSDKDT